MLTYHWANIERWSQAVLRGAQWKQDRQWTQAGTWGNSDKIEGKGFHHNSGQTGGAGAWRGCGISVF